MNESPTTLTPLDSSDSPTESRIGRLGVRAALVLLLLGTACLIAIVSAFQSVELGELPSVIEPVNSLSLLAVGYYFGQKQMTPTK